MASDFRCSDYTGQAALIFRIILPLQTDVHETILVRFAPDSSLAPPLLESSIDGTRTETFSGAV